MATLSKPSKWFANKRLKLSLNRGRSNKSSSSTLSSSPNSPMSPPQTPKTTILNTTNKEEELREVFRHFDGNGDGKISALELRAYFGSIGEYMSHEEAQEVINDFDSDRDNLIDFEDFLKLMNKEACGDDHGEDLKQAFQIFELEKGCLTPKSLQRMFGRLGDSKSYDECVAMIQVFDTDGNGVLDFNEFHQMMTTSIY
ncbi:hypothetical protein UlMin_039459 [Ulmus minor]